MDWGNRKDILVFLEQKEDKPVNVGLESLAPARTLAGLTGGRVLGLVIGGAAAGEKAAAFCDGVITVEGPTFGEGCSDAYVCALEAMVNKYVPAAVLAGNTPLGRELTARLSARLGLGSVQDATALKVEDGAPVWTVPVYGGTVLNDVAADTVPMAVTIRSGAFSKPEAGAAAPVTAETVEVPAGAVKARVLEAVKEISESVNLEEAKVIVTGGRGMGSKENFALVEELAQVLGGVVGATRPAIEDGWVSRAHQVGQSGKIVAPALYIACGVSGATQHVSGMSGSGYVVAINKDEDAPIFDVADVGIIGDAMQVLPVMIEEIRKRKAE
ncbi:MAG: electron transfer flavoprotein subunit alpha/FixB family protein [Oscillospiraceae bacterium]|nr:electron transfer flavoprotein subunit alpha/FixB family protein [Oscillospiraceae bacterium]